MTNETIVDSTDVQSPAGEAERPETADINIAIRCALRGNVDRLVKCFDDQEDTFYEIVAEMINERNDEGKSALDIAAMLGRLGVLKELVNRGADVNNVTKTGYSAMHHAAAWGKIDCVKLLVESEANLHQKTCHGERPRETALRYNQAECVDYLDWAEAKQDLIKAIANVRETLADPEKIQGRLTRDDKNQCNAATQEKETWLQNTQDATTQDFITQRQQMEETLEPIWLKLSEPVPEKK